MLRAEVKKLDAVLFTHSHKDHIAGLDDIRAFNFFQHKPMEVYATTATQAAIRNEFHYVFTDEKIPGLPQMNLHTIDTAPFYIGNIPVIPIHVHHLNMPVLGFRFGNFTYITDANKIEDPEKEKIKGSDILVLNALRKEPHPSHFTLSQAIALTQELEIPKSYFTHISHQLGLHQIINAELPYGIELAWDGMELRP
jgi:phosphoribosyl 1,2-cyclic phosphate phosphodiesterase